jgi:drug/metabolite transporter (DMT)-like permease
VQTTSRRTAVLPLLAALVTVLLWASAFVGIRAAGRDLSPGPLTLLRLAVACLILGAIVLVRRERWPAGRDWVFIVACGLLWFGLYNVVLNEAERRVDAGTAAMLVNVGPLLIALLAGVILREGFPPTLFAGIAVALAGSIVIGFATSGGTARAGWGAVLCIVAAALYAGGVVIQKPLLKRISALQATFLSCAVGMVACLPFAPTLVSELGSARGDAIGWALFLGAGPTALAFTTWAYALARTTAGKMGATTYLVPPIAVGLGWLILHESPPAAALAGGALCLAGVAVSRWRGRRAAPAAPSGVPRDEPAPAKNA